MLYAKQRFLELIFLMEFILAEFDRCRINFCCFQYTSRLLINTHFFQKLTNISQNNFDVYDLTKNKN